MQRLSSFAWRLVSLLARPSRPRVSPRLRIEIRRFDSPRVTAYQLDRPLGDTVIPTKYSYDGESATPHRVFITEYNTELPVEPFMLVMAERLYKIPGIVRSRTPDDCGVKMANQLITVVNDRSRSDEAIEADIVKDFAAAVPAIQNLPVGARRAVRLSYRYYSALFDALQQASPATIKTQRIRVAGWQKLCLLVTARVGQS